MAIPTDDERDAAAPESAAPDRWDAILPQEPRRFVLVHYHIFKNGGSTIEYVLERAFPGRFATVHGPSPDSVLTGEDLAAFIRANPHLTAITSHHLRYPLPAMKDVVIFDICLLRDPIDRLWSMHKYFQRAEPNDEFSRIARVLDLRGFMRFLIDEHPQISNDAQVVLLAHAGDYTRPPNETDLQRAIRVAEEASVLGVLDVFDESMVAAEYHLRAIFNLQFQYIRMNVSDAQPSRQSHGRLIELCGQEVYDALVRLNQLDLRLVEAARAEALRRFYLLPRSADQLRDFHSRCEVLREAHEKQLRASG